MYLENKAVYISVFAVHFLYLTEDYDAVLTGVSLKVVLHQSSGWLPLVA